MLGGKGAALCPQVKQDLATTCFRRNFPWSLARQRKLVLQRGNRQRQTEGTLNHRGGQSWVQKSLAGSHCLGHGSLQTLKAVSSEPITAAPPCTNTNTVPSTGPGLHNPQRQRFQAGPCARTRRLGGSVLHRAPGDGVTIPFFSPRLRTTPQPHTETPKPLAPAGCGWDGWMWHTMSAQLEGDGLGGLMQWR